MMYDKTVFGSRLLVRCLLVVVTICGCPQLPETSVFAWTLVTCTCKHLRQTTWHLFPNASRTIYINILSLENVIRKNSPICQRIRLVSTAKGCLGAKRRQTPVHAQQMKSHPQQPRCIHQPAFVGLSNSQDTAHTLEEKAKCRAFSNEMSARNLPES